MKKIITLCALVFSGIVMAQNIEPKYEIEGNLVKATYYNDNGTVKQEGYYKDGKVHGKWSSFDEKGVKIAMGEYKNGEKTGKWFFWDKNTLNEVDYNDSRVAEAKKWSQGTLVHRN